MKYTAMLVTPQMAKKFLEKNKNNRKIRTKVVDLYAREMSAGRWKYGTGETIKIAQNGVVIDGQHRFLAVVKSGVSIKFDICFDINIDVFDVIDTGLKRTPGDVFSGRGIKESILIPAIIQANHLIESGRGRFGSTETRLTNTQLVEIYYENEDYWYETARKTYIWYKKFMHALTPSIVGAFYVAFSKKNIDAAEDFMNQLCSGVDNNDAAIHKTIHLLRRKLLESKMGQKVLRQHIKNALIIKAWNAFRSHQDLKVLKFDTEAEDYPIIK